MENKQQIDAELIHNGRGGNDNKKFIAYGHFEIEDLVKAQMELGFSPNGYGSPMKIRRGLDVLNRKITTWECYGSCD